MNHPLLDPSLTVARLICMFGEVERVTYHPDGKTRETDTTHTVMLGVLAVSLVHEWYWLGLDPGLVATYALVHDLVEAYAGDTNAFGITAETKASKDAREKSALELIERQTKAFPWIADFIHLYETQYVPEARFVRYLDKALPKLTHIMNGCKALKEMGKTKEDLVNTHAAQINKLQAEYPEFPEIHALLCAACASCDDSWSGP